MTPSARSLICSFALGLAACGAVLATATPTDVSSLFPVHDPAHASRPRSAWKLGESYPMQVSTDMQRLQHILDRSTFLSAGDASYYWRFFGGEETANTEPFRREDMTAAIVGYHSDEGCFAYLPKPMGGGYPLLVVVDGTDGVTRWAFVRINDRGPYGKRGDQRHRPCGWTRGTLRPHPQRIIDLSRGSMRVFMEARAGKKLSNREMWKIGILRNVRLYLPPANFLPEAKVHWQTTETVREAIIDLVRKYPPKADPSAPQPAD